ncbi:MAG TPA: bifunctional 5,10-methylenetetrahydrofolate dehydrogenase/5,10-methenyltetrahydrofolate cyclohydrolase [Methylomirabilota bacterium]|nr:bifunctional 5,10-methylenetetrahydrofolate dehydrogenase/5,10-methenyltetrahydrofolate cyclohydrolase [Methylomirabilota bacterium]
MAIIVDGNTIASHLLNKLKAQIQTARLRPHLAVVLVGNDPASATYVRKKQEAAQSIGIKFSLYKYPPTIKAEELVTEIQRIQEQHLSGIIVQLPLPKEINKQKVLNVLDPEIDVDYLSWESLGKLVIGENPLVPPTPGAILEILDYHKINIKGKHVVLVGQGDLIGKPLSNLLIQMPVTLTVCGRETKNLAEFTKQADILITGVGKANLIRANMVKKGVVVVDAGVSFKGKKMFGDVDFEEVSRVAKLITPTPGGVGPLTVAKLLENTVKNEISKLKK